MTETGAVGGGKPYSDEDKVHLFLAYFGILSLIPFFMFKDKRSDPQKEYVYWHARQGLALAICAICVWIVLMVGMVIPFVNILIMLILCVWWVFIIVMMIMGWVKAFGGQKWAIPGVSKVAEMFN
jgi:uncharacterized membrane protein